MCPLRGHKCQDVHFLLPELNRLGRIGRATCVPARCAPSLEDDLERAAHAYKQRGQAGQQLGARG